MQGVKNEVKFSFDDHMQNRWGWQKNALNTVVEIKGNKQFLFQLDKRRLIAVTNNLTIFIF